MREPPKPSNDIDMRRRVTFEPGAERPSTLQRHFLIREIFRVGERKIEEQAELWWQREIVAAAQEVARERERQRIGRQHVRGVAKRVARKLVQQDQQSEGAARRLGPVIEITARRRLVQGKEAVAEAGVERRVLGEPAIQSGGAPEGGQSLLPAIGSGKGR